MKHIQLFESFHQNEKDTGIRAYQTMQSIMLSDKDRDRAPSEDDGIQVSVLYSDSEYRVFYIAASIPEKLQDKLTDVEGFVFIKMRGEHYYMGIGPEFLGTQSGEVVVQHDGHNDIYRDLEKFNERWMEPLESGKITADEAKGMYIDTKSIFDNRSSYDKQTVEVGEQLPELG